ncbi:MAG: tetratricopeptide repeat protein [Gemmataceae bacterium]
MNRFSARASAILLAVALAIPATARLATAGPVGSNTTPQAKDENIEKAGAALMKGRIDEALTHLQEAVKKNTSLPPARVMLARLCFQAKELQQQGRAQLELAAKENPDHPTVYLTNAGLAMGEGRVTDAVLNAEKALQYSDHPRWVADQKKQFQLNAREVLASAASYREDYASARTHLNALLELEKSGKTRMRLGEALFFLDKPDDAMIELQQAVKDDPSLLSPAVQMAYLWTRKGDTKKAREWLDKAVKAEAGNIRVHLAYADWLLQQNDIDQAKIHADTAEKQDPNSPDVLKLKGLIARIQKDLGTAEKIFRRVYNEQPNDFFASNQLALVLADQTDQNARTKALQHAQVNASANQRNGEAMATYGYVLYRTSQLDEALKVLQATLQGTNGQMSADMAYYLALVLNEKEKAEDAKNILDGALKAKGLFVYRKEAQTLFDRLSKEKPKDKPKP